MALVILLLVLAATAVFSWMKLKTTRNIDMISFVMHNLTYRTGVTSILAKLGLFQRLRPAMANMECPDNMDVVPAPSWLFAMGAKHARNLLGRDDDIYIATYPKAGTTWMQEIVWLICNNADTVEAKNRCVTQRSPFLEWIDFGSLAGLLTLEKWPADKQRIIKTHVPYQLLPKDAILHKKGKVICVVRNPKDLCVSYYHFHKMNWGLPEPGNWSEFLTKFCNGEVPWGDWFTHVLKYWEEYQKDPERIYFVMYESLKKDLRKEVASIAKFLGKDLSDNQIDTITRHCSFETMSKNISTNYGNKEICDFTKSKFMRRGQVGDWKNYFTINQSTAFDKMYAETS